jgi:hypothetical protein
VVGDVLEVAADVFCDGHDKIAASLLIRHQDDKAFTEVPLEAVRVGTPDRRVAPGESVVTVGCNGGADPTIHHSRITAVDKYLGPANVQVAGQPVQGRSGGGLFAMLALRLALSERG